MKEDIYYTIDVKKEPPLTNRSNKKKKCKNQKFKYLNKDVFDIFYEDYIDFKNYINDISKNNFKPSGNLFTEKSEELQQKYDDNTINELNYKIQSLTNENDIIKQENKMLLKLN